MQFHQFIENSYQLTRHYLHGQPIEVWIIDTGKNSRQLAAHYEILSNQEQQQAARLKKPKHAAAYIVAHSFLRHVLSSHLKIAPDIVGFTTNLFGKPLLTNISKGLFFNLARTHGRAAVAINYACPIGIDIEGLNHDFDYSSVLSTVLSNNELNSFNQLGEELTTRAFYKVWTQKEAIIKALGKGLSYPIKKVTTCVDPRQPAGILAIDDAWLQLASLDITEIATASKDCVGSVCAYTETLS